ncbi:MAG: hypothetical protein J1G02_05870 [Clostridiales bacterium]|nr:hypothetical protein [Clostridiales bacterium]
MTRKETGLSAKAMDELIKGLTESTDWAKQKEEVSVKIRHDIIGVLSDMNKRGLFDTEFLNYCNSVKSLLAIQNFGSLPENNTGEESADAKIANELILKGIERILAHVKQGIGYDIEPYLPKDECLEIFGLEDDSDKVVPVTLSAMTVFTVLIYFRRAYKRQNLFSDDELQTENGDIMQEVISVVAELMYNIYQYAVSGTQKFAGWGVTLDPTVSKAITLSDTYAVVDALSRFADAFTKSGLKRDKEFTDAIDDYAKLHFGMESLVDYCLESTYKTAYNVYDATRKVYGKERAFYVLTKNDGNDVDYKYNGTDYDQIAASNRSSALFNPLYIAMITMYGYDDKELVIRAFMDDPELSESYYGKYEKEIVEYSRTLSGYNDEKEHNDFVRDHGILAKKDSKKSQDYSNSTYKSDQNDGKEWKKYYKVARVYQKFLEEKHPEELMEIPAYRDYLNATKDAIDQVVVLYRDFENNQRLGVVDTDYVMYSELDVAVDREDKVSIPKLNKANVAVNNLRPMLLSSKIMIVNALTKYPQSDMKELYAAIINKRHQKINKKNRTKEAEWLWNEDNVDMNSTARHCEAITYDYFDYYEKYELGFLAIKNLREALSAEILADNVSEEDGTFTPGESVAEDGADKKLLALKRLLLELTRQNVDLVKGIYQNNLQERDKENQRLKEEKAAREEKHKKEIENLHNIYQDQLRRQQDSLLMGETLRNWIREEIETFFTRNMAMAVINTLNTKIKTSKNFTEEHFEDMYNGGDIVDAKFDFVKGVWADIVADCDVDPDKKHEKFAKYTEEFKHAIYFRETLSAACNGILEKSFYNTLGTNKDFSLEKRNDEIRGAYNRRKYYGTPEGEKPNEKPNEAAANTEANNQEATNPETDDKKGE